MAKKMSFALDDDLVAWVGFARSLEDTSANAYINNAIRRDMEAADAKTMAAYKATLEAREALREAE